MGAYQAKFLRHVVSTTNRTDAHFFKRDKMAGKKREHLQRQPKAG